MKSFTSSCWAACAPPRCRSAGLDEVDRAAIERERILIARLRRGIAVGDRPAMRDVKCTRKRLDYGE